MTDSWNGEQVQTWIWEKAHSGKLWKWRLIALSVGGVVLASTAMAALWIGTAYPTLIAGVLLAPCFVGTDNKIVLGLSSLVLAVVLALIVPVAPSLLDWALALFVLVVVLGKTSGVRDDSATKGGDV